MRAGAVPADEREVMRLKHLGFFLAEELVNTFSGHTVLLNVEGQVENGAGAARALARKRHDEGHAGQPAFVPVESWARLTERERARLLGEPPRTGGNYQSKHDLAAAVIEKNERIARLEAELAAAQAKPAERRP
jgi:hypothetical protein